MSAPSFDTRDPTLPDFWTERFERAFTPWDRGGVPQQLQAFAAQSTPGTVLIPGCGTGYEVACPAAAGWDVTAIDFSEAAVETARQALGPLAQRVVQADFFEFAPPRPVDVIYERAFLCALPPRMRDAVAARWAALLPPGGLLAGFFFFGDAPKGPPFGIAQAELDALLLPHFERLADEPVPDSLPVFAGKERWQVWRRRAV
ncbi:MAG TPA: methyltransferase domain-containing protein [Noviherbaspirillum sp.]|uniref:methyltransferase domain-containing protein n=1 Tax=Noviherbaspirillum sp. TaxID=1926288 RepID=UPI002D706F7E|nr:methyltransferase domain-containing protein [Noviherbaspirillum sp.]HYD93740.1 methyltransferase domain-containing protein [Noviherbaspirillum sp.]